MKRFLAAAVVTAALLAPLAPAHAIVTRQFSYQGVLTDDTGALLPDGPYLLTVRLYDVGSGGSPIHTESFVNAPVVKGGFSVNVGSIVPLALLDVNRTLYLSLQVGANPELSPRVRLGATPHAMTLTLPAALEDSMSTDMLRVRNRGAGRSLLVEGDAMVGSIGQSGRLLLRHPSSGSNDLAMLQRYAFGQGGELRMNRDDGSLYAALQPDLSGDGGFFGVTRAGGSYGFVVDGNSTNGDPRVSISGTTSTTFFNGGVTGDGAAEFPVGAILANEIGDEAGIAHNGSSTFNNLTGGVTSIISRTITAPALGFVVVMGTGILGIQHSNGSFTRTLMAVDDHVPGSILGASYTLFEKPATDPSGQYYVPGHCVGVYAVAANTSYTFHLLGQEVSPLAAGQGFIENPNLTVMFFPSGYGTVTPSLTTGVGETEVRTSGQSDAEIASERTQSIRANDDRIRSELDAMRVKLDALNAQIARDPQVRARKPE